MLAPWKKSYNKPRQCIKKQRHYFANKGPYSQSCGFPSSHVWMWELNHKEGWAPKNWCFQILVLKETPESPLDCKMIKPVNPKIKSESESHSVVFDSLWPHGLQHARPPYHQLLEFTQSSCPLSRWCHPTTSSSVVPFSSCLQSFPASGYFQMSQFFASGGQSIGVSASTSMNTQDLSPLGWTGWNFLQSKGLSIVFSNTTVQKHQFFSAQLSV